MECNPPIYKEKLITLDYLVINFSLYIYIYIYTRTLICLKN